MKLHHESTAAQALRGKGLEEFLPLCRTRRRWSDRIKEVDVPLFPRYVFCRFSAQDRSQVLATPGVEYIVGTSRSPLAVPDSEVAALQSLMKSGVAAQLWAFLRVGQRVRVEAGPLAGMEGILLQVKEKDYRLVVSVTLLQRSVAVQVNRLDVTPINPPRDSSPSPLVSHFAPALRTVPFAGSSQTATS